MPRIVRPLRSCAGRELSVASCDTGTAHTFGGVAKKPGRTRLPKEECCLDRPRCKRCPIRALAEGTLPPGYTVKRRLLVRIDPAVERSGDGIVTVQRGQAGKATKAKDGQGAKGAKGAKGGKGAKASQSGKKKGGAGKGNLSRGVSPAT